MSRLQIFVMSSDGSASAPFLVGGEPVYIYGYEYVSVRMGETTVNAELRVRECLDDVWTGREYVDVVEGVEEPEGSGSGSGSGSGGELPRVTGRYFLMDKPTSEKSNVDDRYVHRLVFRSERDVRYSTMYFCNVVESPVPGEDRYYVSDTHVEFFGTLTEFMGRFNACAGANELAESFYCDIDAPYKDVPTITGLVKKTEEKLATFDGMTMFEALQEAYKVWEVPFYFDGDAVRFGLCDTVIPDVSFEYGHDEELLSVKRTNKGAKIITLCSGVGSSENIPYYYPNPTPKGTLGVRYNGQESNRATIVDDLLFSSRFAQTAQMTYVEAPEVAEPTHVTTCGDSETSTGQIYTDLESGRKLPFTIVLNLTIPEGGKVYGIDLDFRNVVQASIWDNGEEHDPSGVIFEVADAYLPDAVSGPSFITTGPSGRRGDAQDGRTHIPFEPFATEEDIEYVNYNCYREEHIDGAPYEEAQTTPGNITYKDTAWQLILKDLPDGKTYQIIVEGNVSLAWTDQTTTRVWLLTTNVSSETVNAAIRLAGTVGITMHALVSHWEYGDTSVFDPSYYGLSVNTTPEDGDVITQVVKSYVQPSGGVLLPSIYRGTDFLLRFYPALNEETRWHGYYVGHYRRPEDWFSFYEFGNEYDPAFPRTHIETFDDIKPSIKGARYNMAPIDIIADVYYEPGFNTYDLLDDGETLKYSRFFVKLPPMGFNLFKCASESGAMRVEMTSGQCGACKFDILVTSSGANAVQVDGSGDLVKDENGFVVMSTETVQESQNDTTDNSVWLALKLDDQTYGGGADGTLPSGAVRVAREDTFILSNILFPVQFIRYAEEALEEAIIRFMWENNFEKWSWSIEFSRIYLAQNPDIRDRLSAHSAINLRYDGKDVGTLYVLEYRRRFAEKEALPEIKVTLGDSFDGNTSAFQKRIQAAIGTLPYLGGGTGDVDASRFVTLNTEQTITARKVFGDGFSAGTYVKGVGGQGAALNVNEDGTATLETDYLRVRRKAEFSEIEIDKLTAAQGRVIVSPAFIKCSGAQPVEGGFKCYFDTKADSGEDIINPFRVNDLAICQSFNAGNTKYYWRKVIETGQNYIVLSNVTGEFDALGTDAPAPGDEIVQLGNTADVTRQNAIIIASYGDETPSLVMYAGINSFSLVGKDITSVRYSSTDYQECIEDENGDIYVFEENTGEDTQLNYRFRHIYGNGSYEYLYSDDTAEDSVTMGFVYTDDDFESERIALEQYLPTYIIREPYFSNFGSMLLGDRAKLRDFVEYDNRTGRLSIKADVIFKAGQSLSGIEEFNELYGAMDGWPEVKAAFNGATLISGGLVLTNMIQLGQKVNNQFQVFSGINGQKANSNIAAWFGGPMADKDASPTPANYAKTVFRHDGSGYLAGGQIYWDANGSLVIAGDIPIEGSGGTTLAGLLALISRVTNLESMFGVDQYGDIYVKNRIVGGNSVARAFYNEGAISAGGRASGGGGGSGSGSGGGGGGGVSAGTLNTENTSAQTPQSSESLGGAVNLHRIAKTGSFLDLIGKPTKLSDFTNDGFVTLATEQNNITGQKTFTQRIIASGGLNSGGTIQMLSKDVLTAYTESGGTPSPLLIGYGTCAERQIRYYAKTSHTFSVYKEGQSDPTWNLVLALQDTALYAYRNLEPGSDGERNLGAGALRWNNLHAKRWYPNGANGPYIEFDTTSNAFHVSGNLYADGAISAGGRAERTDEGILELNDLYSHLSASSWSLTSTLNTILNNALARIKSGGITGISCSNGDGKRVMNISEVEVTEDDNYTIIYFGRHSRLEEDSGTWTYYNSWN